MPQGFCCRVFPCFHKCWGEIGCHPYGPRRSPPYRGRSDVVLDHIMLPRSHGFSFSNAGHCDHFRYSEYAVLYALSDFFLGEGGGGSWRHVWWASRRLEGDLVSLSTVWPEFELMGWWPISLFGDAGVGMAHYLRWLCFSWCVRSIWD